MNQKALIIASAILLCSTIPCCKGNIFNSGNESALDDFVQSVMDCKDVPGLALTVVKDDQVWSNGYGLSDMEAGHPVSNTTLFGIGSVSKMFTMVLLGNLIKNTSYTFDSKLSEIEGLDLEFINENLTREVTLADLLSQRTGLSPINDYGFIGGYPKEADRKFLTGKLKYVQAVKPFRSRFVYNNMMFMVLGYVSEVLGKDTWENLMTSRILEPIGMTSSKIIMTSNDIEDEAVAQPYIFKNDQFSTGNKDIYDLTPLQPAGLIMSNGVDMAKWMRFLLNNATTDSGEQLMDPDELQQAWNKSITINPIGVGSITRPTYPIDDVTDGYGYAFFTSKYRDIPRFWHSGGLFSYVSLLWLFPSKNMGVFGNVNGPGLPKEPGTALKTILSYASDLALEQDPWLSSQTACSFPQPWAKVFHYNLPPPLVYQGRNLSDFVGSFGTELLPDATISLKARKTGGEYLWLELNRIKGELLPSKLDDRYNFKLVEPWEYARERVLSGTFTLTYIVTFGRDEDNVVSGFNMTLGAEPKPIYYRKGFAFMSGNVSSSTENIISASNKLQMHAMICFSLILLTKTIVLV